MLGVKHLSLSFPGKVIFDNVSFSIRYNQKVGIVGRNGAGKSTLLKILAGDLQADEASISYNKRKTIAYLPQELVMVSDKTVYQEVRSAFDRFVAFEREARELEQKLENADVEDAAEYVERYAQLQEELMQFDQSTLEAQIVEVLTGLGFDQQRWNQSVQELSVGWRMRVVLAKLLLVKADLYLFDEPTNHLDLSAKEWFITFLRKAAFGYLLVTHDRYFLQKACDTIIELTRGKATVYTGNYDAYLTQKEANEAQLRAAYIVQQKEIAHKQEIINRFRASATKAAMVQSMIKELDKIERIELEPSTAQVRFSFSDVVRAGRIVINVEHVSYAYDDKQLFKNVSFEIERGKKVALIAPNGVGKTTLFNVIAGKLPIQSGSVTFGHNVTYAYFEQDQARVLDGRNTVLEEVSRACTQSTEAVIRSMLGAFLFPGDDVQKKISVLSGGERNRVAMVKVLLQKANLLLLDEPTNHLDMQSKEVLLQALKHYQGTILFVSHDHYFIEQLADQIVALSRNGAYVYDGDYESYLYAQRVTQQKDESGDTKQTSKEQLVRVTSVETERSRKNEDGSKEIRAIERTIQKLEEKRDKLVAQLGVYEYGSEQYQQAMQSYNATMKELEEAEKKWEQLIP
jgi:ATP-binding cassette subfamily F protein 3